MRILIVFTIVLLALGCATRAEQQHERMRSMAQAAWQRADNCKKLVYSRPFAKALSNVLWMSTDAEAPLSFSINESTVTQDHLGHLDQFAQASLSCDHQLRKDMESVHPKLGLIISQHAEAKRGIYLTLLQRKISFGDAQKRFRKLGVLTEQAWVKTSQAIANQLAQEHEAELQARQMALQTFADAQMALAASQPAPASRQVPVYPERRLTKQTNCYATSTGMRCTTW